MTIILCHQIPNLYHTPAFIASTPFNPIPQTNRLTTTTTIRATTIATDTAVINGSRRWWTVNQFGNWYKALSSR